jgi:hypothetical protein
MDIDAFRARVAGTPLHLPRVDPADVRTRVPETVDALFHLPLLALAIMTIARSKPFRTINLGRFVAALFVEHFYALRGAAHALELSLTLRRRCVSALVLLELVGLVTVSRDRRRMVELTPQGKAQIEKARSASTDLGLLVRGLRVSFSRSVARRGVDER